MFQLPLFGIDGDDGAQDEGLGSTRLRSHPI
jgi:hypothetical protein